MKKIVLTALMFPAALAVHADVTHVEFHQDPHTRHVHIDYVLDAPGIVTVDFLTNGVSIGAENFRNATGDVNRYVKAPGGRIDWQPYAMDGWPGHKIADGSFKAVVTAWATNAPPDYMAVDLNTKSNVLFYVSEAALPKPVTDDIWKTEWLLMRKIPAANVIWRMGSPATESGRSATKEEAHLVRLTYDYYMGVYKVTQRQYFLFSGGKKPSTKCTSDTTYPDHWTYPVNCVKFSGMRGTTYDWPQDGHKVTADSAFGLLRAHSGIDSFDMPTEAEWEYACRAGTGTRSYDGTENTTTLTNLAWYVDNSAVDGSKILHTVGLKLPNAWGLYDMYGNVFDMCLDHWDGERVQYVVTELVTVDPEGLDTGTSCVSRGGSIDHGAEYSRSASRNSSGREGSSWYQALRLRCAANVSL